MSETKSEKEKSEHGKALHREFVGMLFALAIAQVAVESADIINSSVDSLSKAPAFAHLLLATVVIAASWVGWGRSDYSLSPVEHLFTWDIIELSIDVWLVGVYFFLVRGAESLTEGGKTIEHGSAAIEALWVMVMFISYLAWDWWTKRKDTAKLKQRGWASLTCMLLAIASWALLKDLRGTATVVCADFSLLAVVLLFRAMKMHDFSEHTSLSRKWMTALATLWVLFLVAAVQWNGIVAAGRGLLRLE